LLKECRDLYLLELFNNEVITKRYIDNNSFRTLRREGEHSQRFDSDYWEWFKEKINYTDELICMIVVTDIEIFEIDKSLILADICPFNPSLNYQGGKVFRFPSKEYRLKVIEEQKRKDRDKVRKQQQEARLKRVEEENRLKAIEVQKRKEKDKIKKQQQEEKIKKVKEEKVKKYLFKIKKLNWSDSNKQLTLIDYQYHYNLFCVKPTRHSDLANFMIKKMKEYNE